MTRQRFFTDEYRLGDYVYIIRTRHGWHDRRINGEIVKLEPHKAVVRDNFGTEYEIDHPRDISPM